MAEEFEIVDGVLVQYNGPGGDVVIPEGVTEIGEYAFRHRSYVTSSATIPEGVTAIGEHAFADCFQLKSVSIPASVTRIGRSAFSSCSSLTSVTIPEGVTEIAEETFYHCSSLKSVAIPASVTTIGEHAFSNCSLLASTPIPEGVTEVGRAAFSDCFSITSVTIPEGMTRIGSYAFSGCLRLGTVVIPEGVDRIADNAFSGCAFLRSVILPESLRSIGSGAFNQCTSLKSITIPEHVQAIGSGAFGSCTSLKSVTIPEQVQTIGNSAFERCTSLKSVRIPESVVAIGDSGGNPFQWCESLRITLAGASIPRGLWLRDEDSQVLIAPNIPSSAVTMASVPKRALLSGYLFAIGAGNTVDLDDDSRKYIRSHAQKLLEYVDYDVTAVKGIVSAGLIGRPTAGKLAGVCAQAGRTEAATILADYAEATKGKAETSKRKTADEGSSAVQSPETLNFEILHGVLKKYKGEDEIVVIPGGISEIGSGAFDGCGHIKSVAFPKGVKKVGDWAFFNCTSLKEVHVPSLEAWLKIDFADGAANPLGCGARLFIGGKPLEEDLVIPAGVKSIGANAFTVWDSLRSVVIPDGVTRIGKGAFNECDSLQSVAIPDTVTRIGEGAFAYCCSLRSVAIPSGVTRICDSLFEGCESLEAVTIPEGVKTIGYRAFAECASLKCVTIPGSVTAIGEDAFNEAKGIKYLGARIPSSLNIGQGQVFLAPRMRLAEIKTIRIPKASAVAGYLLLAASGEVPEFDSDCCAYTGRHVKEIVELVEYDAPSMRLLLEKGLIGKPTAQKLAIECSAAGHTEAAALLMDFAGGKKKTRLEL